MATNSNDFMNALGQCCDRENYLSDVTYAMCESNPEFRELFIGFFFPELDAKQVDITREYRFKDSRPDFLVESRLSKDFFIIEVKINDRHHHFKQYEKVLMELYGVSKKFNTDNKAATLNYKSHVGYIANYKITSRDVKESKGFESGIRTWKEFYDMLNDSDLCKGDETIKGYAQLCKDVCGFTDLSGYHSIQLKDFQAIEKSREWIEETVRGYGNDVTPYDGYYQQACSRYWKIGRFFEIKNYSKKTSAWGWIGIYLVENGAQCVIAFENRKGWGNLVCERVGVDAYSKQGQTIEYDTYDKSLYFYMNGDFSSKNLKAFFDKTMRYIRGEKGAFTIEEQNLAKCNEWLSMAKLPALIKSELFKGWTDKSYEVFLSESGMNAYQYARNISSSCVEWFEMSFKARRTGTKRQHWGFVGVVWNECEWIGHIFGKRLKGNPTFVVGIYDLGKQEKKIANRHGWKEQKEKKTWVKIIGESDLKSVARLRKSFESILKTILPKRSD